MRIKGNENTREGSSTFQDQAVYSRSLYLQAKGDGGGEGEKLVLRKEPQMKGSFSRCGSTSVFLECYEAAPCFSHHW